jgi:hypothetical protein
MLVALGEWTTEELAILAEEECGEQLAATIRSKKYTGKLLSNWRHLVRTLVARSSTFWRVLTLFS